MATVLTAPHSKLRMKKVYVYRPGLLVEKLDDPETISDELSLIVSVMPVAELWQK